MREEFGDDWPEKVKVVFAGDDTTDEDAMKVITMFFFSTYLNMQMEIPIFRLINLTETKKKMLITYVFLIFF